jgi:hypothetical protein
MKIMDLLSGISLALTNEEHQFINTHGHQVPVMSLSERDSVLAHTLVKKGAYNWSSDRKFLINPRNEKI